MKKRIISALIALAIVLPVLRFGGVAFNIGVYVVSMLALKEFLDIKAVRKQLPIFIQFIAYIFMTLIVLVDVRTKSMSFTLDYRILSALFMTFLFPVVFYHDRKRYSITDAFYMIGGLLFLSISMSLLIIIRNISLSVLTYLFIIPIFCDTFAYISGSLVGKRKLLESISPNKTVEGMVFGTLMSVFAGSVFYLTVIDSSFSIIGIVFITTFLSIIGQLGDLVFSAIKRYFGKKDFSNIMPGHGGILDRLDSIIFVILGYIFFINII